ncbi:helix-turn-helix transcriptional regulator [uncultured Phascolarctobacterium sp.]|uniref:helix-turn-helix transcriptional regulator n=1 Tax=uncultured Phascolarctobacterium sp. TaxID=512296 RepID=UPI0025FBBC1A|nr:helix-turn-helix transcriptional regulator [uncultured Phascolarctobacterium sp.]
MASLTVNPDYKLIGNNIRQMRTKLQVSQQSLAKAINISQTHMSNLGNGKTGVSLAIAIRISKHLNSSLDELIFGADKKSYPVASKPLSDHTVDEFNQILKRSLAEMMFQCLQHSEDKHAK